MIWYFLIWYLPVPYLAFRYSAHIDISIWYFFDIILLIYHIISLWYIDIQISHERLKNFDEIWRSIVQNEKIFYVSAHLRTKATSELLNQKWNGKISRYGGASHLFFMNPPKKPAKMVVDCLHLSNSRYRYIEIYFDICDMISAHIISKFVIFPRSVFRYDIFSVPYHCDMIYHSDILVYHIIASTN